MCAGFQVAKVSRSPVASLEIGRRLRAPSVFVLLHFAQLLINQQRNQHKQEDAGTDAEHPHRNC